MSSDRSDVADEELARESRDGSMVSFDELARRYEARIFGFLCQRTSLREDARDLTQLTFVQAYRKLEQYDTRRPFAAWLFAIARRQAIDWFRRQRPVEVLSETVASGDMPAADCDAADRARSLWATIRVLLAEREFTALWLMYREAMSVAEIALALGQSSVSVKVILFRARRKLAQKLPEEFRDIPDLTPTERSSASPTTHYKKAML